MTVIQLIIEMLNVIAYSHWIIRLKDVLSEVGAKLRKTKGPMNHRMMKSLDNEIISITLKAARKFVAEGVSPDEAVKRATPGAWKPYRRKVKFALENLPRTESP